MFPFSFLLLFRYPAAAFHIAATQYQPTQEVTLATLDPYLLPFQSVDVSHYLN